MEKDGKKLEDLIAFVEQEFVPEGFVVEKNKRVFGEGGAPEAEFDVIIRGRIGSGDFSWLIECRDRPSSGPAPAAWVEQLVGRRSRFQFNKVTAVSTTGFGKEAVRYAEQVGIELREVEALSPEHFADWFKIERFTKITRHATLIGVGFVLQSDAPKKLRDKLRSALPAMKESPPLLQESSSGKEVSIDRVFGRVVFAQNELFDALRADSERRTVTIVTRFDESSHFILRSTHGPIPVLEIKWTGEVYVTKEELAIQTTGEYRSVSSGEDFSQTLIYEPFACMDKEFQVEMHKLKGEGVYVLVRRHR